MGHLLLCWHNENYDVRLSYIFKQMVAKIEELEKQMKEKSKKDDESELERLKRETKEEASKAEVNVDVLYEKLLL